MNSVYHSTEGDSYNTSGEHPTGPTGNVAHVAILMCTYNGAKFLPQQLESFVRQTHTQWSLHVSDDGSSDETLSLLETYTLSNRRQKCQVIEGPRAGFVRNFLSLSCRSDIQADYYAWSDQDDIWKDEKLEVAVKWMQEVPPHIPAIYCGRTQLIDEDNSHIGMSPNFSRPPHFKNALIQSIAGGNTMLFNKAARALIVKAGAHLTVPSHDWWCYQLVCGAGGIVHYDPVPQVLYRQHTGNIIGSNADWRARAQRLVMVFEGRFYDWNTQNIKALESMCHQLSEEHRKTLALFKRTRKQRLPARVLNMLRTGLYRQTLLGNLGLALATLLRKI
ncbi:glycosyltransferase family 2 protein [Pseudomonas sp. NY15463]|uniref:glycosyltransferase family 2 protein n=1 Tax=Pseudomonas sp. NY15463 TaxID=3400361 RepID=UPI003A882BA3